MDVRWRKRDGTVLIKFIMAKAAWKDTHTGRGYLSKGNSLKGPRR